MALAQSRDTNWALNGGENNIRYSPLTQINKSNVASLQVAWTYTSGDHFTASVSAINRSSGQQGRVVKSTHTWRTEKPGRQQ